MSSVRRISVSLEGADQEVLDAFATEDRAERVALEAWAAEHGTIVRGSSDAALVRVLVRVGAEALRERAMERGYAELAADVVDDVRAECRSLRDGYVSRTEARFAE